jgi:hypothetical protein
VRLGGRLPTYLSDRPGDAPMRPLAGRRGLSPRDPPGRLRAWWSLGGHYAAFTGMVSYRAPAVFRTPTRP